MATAGAKSNAKLNFNSISGGVVKVSLSTGLGRGNDGTSQPCRMCYIKEDEGNSAVVRMNVDATATANSFPLGEFNGTTHQMKSQSYEIDDVAKLYFYSTDTDAIVYILYRI